MPKHVAAQCVTSFYTSCKFHQLLLSSVSGIRIRMLFADLEEEDPSLDLLLLKQCGDLHLYPFPSLLFEAVGDLGLVVDFL